MAGQNVLEFTDANWEKEVEQSDVPVVVGVLDEARQGTARSRPS